MFTLLYPFLPHTLTYTQVIFILSIPADETASESSQPSSHHQQQEETVINAIERTESTSLVERGETSQSRSQEDDSSSPHRTHTGSECSCRTDRTQPNNTSSSSNEALSHSVTKAASTTTSNKTTSTTLNEVPDSAQSQEQANSRLDLGTLRAFTINEDDMHAPGDGDTIVVTSEEGGQNEVEVRTNEKGTAATADSDESFIVQGCTDAVERTTSESPQSVTDKTGQTSVSSSLSSSQEPQQASSKSTSRRRGGSAGPRSQRSVSRASSVCSEVGGEGEKETPTKGKRRQKVHVLLD